MIQEPAWFQDSRDGPFSGLAMPSSRRQRWQGRVEDLNAAGGDDRSDRGVYPGNRGQGVS